MSRLRQERQYVALIVALALVAAACGGSPNAEPASAPDTEEYPDAIVRELERRANEPRPVERSALPPRHLKVDRFPEALVDRNQIVSGGPPADGIRSIDDPTFAPVAEVDWLEDNEPVLTLTIGDDVRAYPYQIMIWHEIVNDTFGDRPVVVTYCPLCNSGVAFDRVLDGRVLDFGTSGALYRSALVMYDRQTESFWTHFDGRAVIGDLIGTSLDLIPLASVSWKDFREAHPDGLVLGPASSPRPYGRNPYGAYDQGDNPLPGFFTGEVDERAPAMGRVVGLQVDDAEVAVSLDRLSRDGVVHLSVEGRPVVVWHLPGTASALNAPRVADGDDVGATGAFFTDLRFERNGQHFVDDRTGSTWNILGMATDGELAGTTLDPVIHLDTFWFAWSSYHPDTDVID